MLVSLLTLSNVTLPRRLYLDADVSAHLVPALQTTGITAHSAHEAGASLQNDAQQLETATYVWELPIVTHNAKDFKLLHQAWQLWSHRWGVMVEHTGILVLPHGAPALSAQRLQDFFRAGQPIHNRLYRYFPARGWTEIT